MNVVVYYIYLFYYLFIYFIRLYLFY